MRCGDGKSKRRTPTPGYPRHWPLTLILFPTQPHTMQGLFKENLLESASEMHGAFGGARGGPEPRAPSCSAALRSYAPPARQDREPQGPREQYRLCSSRSSSGLTPSRGRAASKILLRPCPCTLCLLNGIRCPEGSGNLTRGRTRALGTQPGTRSGLRAPAAVCAGGVRARDP